MKIRDNLKNLKIREHLKYKLEAWLQLNENYYRSENRQINAVTALNALGNCYPEELLHTEKYLRQLLGTN